MLKDDDKQHQLVACETIHIAIRSLEHLRLNSILNIVHVFWGVASSNSRLKYVRTTAGVCFYPRGASCVVRNLLKVTALSLERAPSSGQVAVCVAPCVSHRLLSDSGPRNLIVFSIAFVTIRDRRFDDRPPSELFSKQVSPIAICQLGTRIGRTRRTGDTRAEWDGESRALSSHRDV